jgi:Zn-dependent metalloprotease
VERQIYDCKGTEELPGTLVRSEGGDRTSDRQVNNTYDGFGIVRNFFQGKYLWSNVTVLLLTQRRYVKLRSYPGSCFTLSTHLSCVLFESLASSFFHTLTWHTASFVEIFGRNSLDNEGLTLMGSIHYTPSDSPAGYNNAYWNGNSNQMVFGDGDHIAFDYLTDSLDVIGHELSHGFVQYSSPLVYQNQSGALNESCADIFGSMAEQWHTHQTVDDADWNLGQTLFPIAFTGSCLRTLKAGKAYADDPVFGTDPQPKHMKDLYTGDEDGGGVHINSGIPNHACKQHLFVCELLVKRY